jgi:hypothetical protein
MLKWIGSVCSFPCVPLYWNPHQDVKVEGEVHRSRAFDTQMRVIVVWSNCGTSLEDWRSGCLYACVCEWF